METTALNNTIIKLKDLIQGFNNRLDQIEERISELRDRAVEFIQPEKQQKK